MEQKRVLVAEDQEYISSAVETALTEAGYAVTKVEDGEAALAVYEELEPNIILLDINLPKIDGVEVLKHIRENKHFKNTPITVLTAHDSLTTISDVTEVGGMKTDFLSKTDNTLEQIVEHIRSRTE